MLVNGFLLAIGAVLGLAAIWVMIGVVVLMIAAVAWFFSEGWQQRLLITVVIGFCVVNAVYYQLTH